MFTYTFKTLIMSGYVLYNGYKHIMSPKFCEHERISDVCYLVSYEWSTIRTLHKIWGKCNCLQWCAISQISQKFGPRT